MSDLRAILHYPGVLAVLGSAVAGIRDSCSGFVGCRLPLANRNATETQKRE
jgi:hypothetical protein